MFVLVRIDVNPALADQPADCTEVNTSGFFGSLQDAQKAMTQEIMCLVEKYNETLKEEWTDGDNPRLDEGDDYECNEMQAWLAWPVPIKWQIIEVPAEV